MSSRSCLSENSRPCSLDHSITSQPFTEVSHLSAFTVSSRALSLRISTAGSQFSTPRVIEGWPAPLSSQTPSSVCGSRALESNDSSVSGTNSTGEAPLRRPPRATSSRSAALPVCSTAPACGDVSPRPEEGTAQTEIAGASISSTAQSRPSSASHSRPSRGRSASSVRPSRSSSKEDAPSDDGYDLQSLGGSSPDAGSTLAGTSISTLSNITMPDTVDGAPSPESGTRAGRRRESSTWSCSNSSQASSRSSVVRQNEPVHQPLQEDLLDILVKKGTFEVSGRGEAQRAHGTASWRQQELSDHGSEDLGWRADACFADYASRCRAQSPSGPSRPLSALTVPEAAPHAAGHQDASQARQRRPSDALDKELLRSSDSLRHPRQSPSPEGRGATPSGGGHLSTLGRSSTLKSIGRVICSTQS